MKKLYLTIIIAAVISIVLAGPLGYGNFLRMKYYILFKKTGRIVNYDQDGFLNGNIITLKAGDTVEAAKYVHGNKEGWTYVYYPNNRVHYKKFYHLNAQDGPEIAYYPNGRVNYTGTIRYGNRFGSLYWFSNDGILDSYSTYDFTGTPFYTVNYDHSGNIQQIINQPVSSKTFSIDTLSGKLVPLKFDETNQPIRDLFIIIGVAPHISIDFTVTVNGSTVDNLKMVNDVIQVKDAFSKHGLNAIYLTLRIDNKKKMVKNVIYDFSILKK